MPNQSTSSSYHDDNNNNNNTTTSSSYTYTSLNKNDNDNNYNATSSSLSSSSSAGAPPGTWTLKMPSSGKPPKAIVIIIGWWGCQSKHLEKYSSGLYTLEPFNYATLYGTAPFRSILFKHDGTLLKFAKDGLNELSNFLQQEQQRIRLPIFVHLFSNGGGFVWQQMENLLLTKTLTMSVASSTMMTTSQHKKNKQAFLLNNNPTGLDVITTTSYDSINDNNTNNTSTSSTYLTTDSEADPAETNGVSNNNNQQQPNHHHHWSMYSASLTSIDTEDTPLHCNTNSYIIQQNLCGIIYDSCPCYPTFQSAKAALIASMTTNNNSKKGPPPKWVQWIVVTFFCIAYCLESLVWNLCIKHATKNNNNNNNNPNNTKKRKNRHNRLIDWWNQLLESDICDQEAFIYSTADTVTDANYLKEFITARKQRHGIFTGSVTAPYHNYYTDDDAAGTGSGAGAGADSTANANGEGHPHPLPQPQMIISTKNTKNTTSKAIDEEASLSSFTNVSPVHVLEFHDSDHVQHYKKHPEEYTNFIHAFVSESLEIHKRDQRMIYS